MWCEAALKAAFAFVSAVANLVLDSPHSFDLKGRASHNNTFVNFDSSTFSCARPGATPIPREEGWEF